MHALAAERLAERLSVPLVGEHEHLEETAVAVYRVPVARQRQPALPAEFSERLEALADALGRAEAIVLGAVALCAETSCGR
jgi:hypothetical protein